MNIEQQLEKIKSKAELLRFVDGLPDDVRGVVLVEDATTQWMKFYEVGSIQLRDCLWLVNAFLTYLQKTTFTPCDGDCEHGHPQE